MDIWTKIVIFVIDFFNQIISLFDRPLMGVPNFLVFILSAVLFILMLYFAFFDRG